MKPIIKNRMSIITLFFALITLFFNIVTDAQTTHYVSLSGTNISPYSSWETAATNIQNAVDASSSGDIILVGDGTYTLTTSISVTKSVTIRSVNGYNLTIVDGNLATRCFYINDVNAIIDGFTITHGRNISGFGGGVQCDNGTIQNCIIENNASRDGGGVALDNSGMVINCIIRNNTADWGGGVRLFNGTVRGCLITGNTATPHGGGINIWSRGLIQNCTIANNTATDGAGIRLWNNGVVENSIIYFNTGSSNYIIDSGTGNSLSYSCTTPLFTGTGNISDDPLFVNAAGGDYHLSSSSTLINAGLNSAWMNTATDLDGNNRTFNVTVDIGAYEYTVINTYTLSLTATNGIVTKNPEQVNYNEGTNVTLTATADAGYHFLGWSGDASGNTNPLIVTMNGNKNIKANFLPLNVIAFDDFDRVNELPLLTGGNWQNIYNWGNVYLSGNQVSGNSGEALYYWNGNGSFDNSRQFAKARVVNANGQVGLMLLGGNNQALNVSWNTGTLYIYWYLNGSHQGELAHVSSTIHDGDIIEAVLDGGIIYAKINGTIVHSVPNTTSLTSGNPGFEFYQGGAVFDDWEAGTPTISSYTITASAGAGGSISPNGSVIVTSGNNQSFTITPNTGNHIVDVLVDGVSAGAVTNYSFNNVTANHTISASFTINSYTLTITSVNGIVSKNPDQANYSHGSTVQLTATPSSGYTFTGWSGDATGSINPLTVTMDGNKNITANFTINTYTLTITSVNGSVTKNPDQANYAHGSTVQLTATPSSGYTFTGWSGDATGSTNPLTVTMDANKNITANYSVDNDTYIEISSASALAGSSITIPVRVHFGSDSNIPQYILQGKIIFDATKLKYRSNSAGALFTSMGWTITGYSSIVGQFDFIATGYNTISTDGILFNLNFDVISNANGSTQITSLPAYWLSNSSNTPHLFSSINPGTIIISEQSTSTVSGDADGNFNVDFRDAVAIINHVLNISILHGQSLINADVDHNGNITLADAIGIILYSVFGDWNYSLSILSPLTNAIFSVDNPVVDNSGVILPIKIKNANNVRSLEVKVEYDPTKFSYDSFSAGINSSNTIIKASQILPGQAKFIFASSELMNNDFTAGSITLKTKNGTLLNSGSIKTSYKINDGKEVAGALINTGTTDIETDYSHGIPSKFELVQNYPNPFNPTTVIDFRIPINGYYVVKVFNAIGQTVSVLAEREFSAGNYKVTFDGNNLSSGIYFYQLFGNNVNIIKKMMLIK